MDLFKRNDTKITLILADMLELSNLSIKIHKQLGKYINDLNFVDHVYGIGEFMKHTIDSIDNARINKAHFPDNDSFIRYYKKKSNDSNIIYLKGSRGMKMEDIITGLKN